MVGEGKFSGMSTTIDKSCFLIKSCFMGMADNEELLQCAQITSFCSIVVGLCFAKYFPSY